LFSKNSACVVVQNACCNNTATTEFHTERLTGAIPAGQEFSFLLTRRAFFFLLTWRAAQAFLDNHASVNDRMQKELLVMQVCASKQSLTRAMLAKNSCQ
jgi:hypothetical protein